LLHLDGADGLRKPRKLDAINQAVSSAGIRDSKAKADKAHYANGPIVRADIFTEEIDQTQETGSRYELQSLLQARRSRKIA